MGKYKKCPRCELNWIAVEEELCEVCKAELGKESKISLLEEDEEDGEYEERICPICKVNFLEGDEDMCAACREERAEKLSSKDDEDEGWKEFVDEEEPVSSEEEELSLSQLQDDESEEDEEDEEESSPDDFDDFDYGDVNDYEEDDESDDELDDLDEDK